MQTPPPPPHSLSPSSSPSAQPPPPPPPSPPAATLNFSLTLSTPPAITSSPSTSSSSSSSPSPPPHQRDPRLFPCLFCNKKFLKSQALGGHQNAHKKERSVTWSSHHLYITPPPPPLFAAAASLPIESHGCRAAVGEAAECFGGYGGGAARFGGAFGQHLLSPAAAAAAAAEDVGDGCETMDFLNWQRGSVHDQWEGNADGDAADEEGEAEVDLSLRL